MSVVIEAGYRIVVSTNDGGREYVRYNGGLTLPDVRFLVEVMNKFRGGSVWVADDLRNMVVGICNKYVGISVLSQLMIDQVNWALDPDNGEEIDAIYEWLWKYMRFDSRWDAQSYHNRVLFSPVVNIEVHYYPMAVNDMTGALPGTGRQ